MQVIKRDGSKEDFNIRKIEAAVTAAFGEGFSPIPFSDAALLVPTQVAMIASITTIFGIEVSKGLLTSFVSSTIGSAGATILGREGIKQAYTTGRGKITLRAEAEIEEMSNTKQRIIVSSLPYQVNKAKLIENMARLVREKRIEGISEIRDESDRIDRVRIVIELKRDAKALGL